MHSFVACRLCTTLNEAKELRFLPSAVFGSRINQKSHAAQECVDRLLQQVSWRK
jgi:hypothetical protein